jgi:hypothetical protein
MQRPSRLLSVALAAALATVLSACGDNNITGLATASPTATANHTFTPTQFSGGDLPTLTPTAFVPPASATATAIRPTASATATAIPPTATRSSVPTATATATLVPTAAAAMALFNADPMNPLNPFPSDRLRQADGHVHVPAEYLQIDAPNTPEFQVAYAYSALAADQLTELTGFGTFAPLRIRFDRTMVVDSGINPRGILLLEYDDLTSRPPLITATAYDPDKSIEVQPVVPLKSKTTYAVVVTTQITDANGNHAAPSPDFGKLLAGTDLSPALTAWRSRLLPVLNYLHDEYDLGPDSLALVDVFTTVATTDDLVAIEHRLSSGELTPGLPVFDRPLGNLETGIFAEGTPQFADLIGAPTSSNTSAVGIGYFESFDFRAHANGAFDPGRVNGPTIPTTNKVDFYMTIPKAPKPANGYPIVLFGHGLGGSGRDVARITELGQNVPIVGIGISALQHGRRGNVTKFFVLGNIATTREYFRQTVADFLQVIRMIQVAHDAGIAPFRDIDPQHIQYLGGSLGGIMGTPFMAVAPDVQVGVLSVPGGGLPNILASRDIGMLLEPLLALTVGIPPDSPYFATFLHRFQQTSQWALESADPINYAPHIIVPGEQLPGAPVKSILMHEGVVDSTVPNRTTDDLALAMRLPDLNLTRGCMNPSGCNGIWRFLMTDYGKGPLDGHTVTAIVPQATQQAFDYLTSFGTLVSDASP